MPCYYPLQAISSPLADGKRDIKVLPALRDMFVRDELQSSDLVVNEGVYSDTRLVQLPCGRCMGCRLERSRQWAVRIMHEAKLHDQNCFVTLTYSNEHLPADYSVDKRHFQLFFKRLRMKYGSGIRFYHCGEYGEESRRPHYHACIFGFDFPDKEFYKNSYGHPLYTSKALSELWPFGISTIGRLTFESAAYVARYVTKKVNGSQADEHYRCVHPISGKVCQQHPEYSTMSRRPGIARNWFEQYGSDAYPSDFLIVNGHKAKPPRYYDKLYDVEYPSNFVSIKEARVKRAKSKSADSSHRRLMDKEKVLQSRIKRLNRPL